MYDAPREILKAIPGVKLSGAWSETVKIPCAVVPVED